MSPDSYAAFAWAYDQALGERFFRAVRGLVADALVRHGAGSGGETSHLDLACGTGLALEMLRGRGWTSCGLDASLPMLDVARGRAASAALIAADLRALPLRRTFALVTCLYDSFNHLLEREDLEAAFRETRRVMRDDALLLFDVNHPRIYPLVWGTAEPFSANGAGWELEIATTYRPRAKMGKAMVTGWALTGGRRVEIREQHRQRAWSEHEVTRALADAGLRVREVFDFDPYGESGPAAKLFFECGVA